MTRGYWKLYHISHSQLPPTKTMKRVNLKYVVLSSLLYIARNIHNSLVKFYQAMSILPLIMKVNERFSWASSIWESFMFSLQFYGDFFVIQPRWRWSERVLSCFKVFFFTLQLSLMFDYQSQCIKWSLTLTDWCMIL